MHVHFWQVQECGWIGRRRSKDINHSQRVHLSQNEKLKYDSVTYFQILLVPGASCQKRYSMTAARGPARQWLALEEAFGRDPVLAPSTSLDSITASTEVAQKNPPNSRNVFAIIVSYYVKVEYKENMSKPFLLSAFSLKKLNKFLICGLYKWHRLN